MQDGADNNELKRNGTLDSLELKLLAPFAIHDEIQSGDVLLTLGHSLHSKVITTVTGGDYSHAALWLQTAEHPETLMLAEADGYGVGFTPLMPVTFRSSDRFGTLTYSLEGAPKRYQLLRHPGIQKLDQKFVTDTTELFVRTFFNKSYSDLERLVNAVNLHPVINSFARKLLGFADKFKSDSKQTGSFCSELVAAYFQLLDLPLHADKSLPVEISPNDLCSPQCLLEPVYDAFIHAESICDNSTGFAAWGRFSREQLVPINVGIYAQSCLLNKVCTEFEAFGTSVIRESRMQTSVWLKMQLISIEDSLKGRVDYGIDFDTLLCLRAAFHTLAFMNDSESSFLPPGSNNSADREDAYLYLMVTKLFNAVMKSFNKSMILGSLRHLRSLRQEPSLTKRNRKMLLRQRLDGIYRWKKLRADHLRYDAELNKCINDLAVDLAMNHCIHEFAIAAKEAARNVLAEIAEEKDNAEYYVNKASRKYFSKIWGFQRV